MTCGETAEATVLDRGGKVYQRIRCKTHPETEHLILSDGRLQQKLEEWNRRIFSATSPSVDEDEGKAPLLAVIVISTGSPQ